MNRNQLRMLKLAAVLASLPFVPVGANAQLAVSANDAKVTLVDGVLTVVANPPADTVTIIDLGVSPPKVIAELAAPASVVGPPQSVAVAPDESIALVTASTMIDPADPKKFVPDDRVSVIDLTASPPVVLATLQAGKGASGVSINRAGTLALVANRDEGTVSVFTIAGKTVTPAGKVELGNPKAVPNTPVFTADGKTALVSRAGDHMITVLTIDGSKVELAKRDIAAGLRPDSMDITPTGDIAVVANIGMGGGDADTVSVIDVAAKPARVVQTVTVGPTPEGIKLSPDGNFLAVTVMNGSNKPKASPIFHDYGLLKILRLTGQNLDPVAEIKVGHWCQGAAWNKTSDMVLVQCMVEKEILVFAFDGNRLTPMSPIKVNGGPAGIRTAEH